VVDKVQAPTVFLHGRKDRIVPFYHSKKLYQKFKGEGDFIELDLDHNDPRPMPTKEKLKQFLKSKFMIAKKDKEYDMKQRMRLLDDKIQDIEKTFTRSHIVQTSILENSGGYSSRPNTGLEEQKRSFNPQPYDPRENRSPLSKSQYFSPDNFQSRGSLDSLVYGALNANPNSSQPQKYALNTDKVSFLQESSQLEYREPPNTNQNANYNGKGRLTESRYITTNESGYRHTETPKYSQNNLYYTVERLPKQNEGSREMYNSEIMYSSPSPKKKYSERSQVASFSEPVADPNSSGHPMRKTTQNRPVRNFD